MFHQTIYAQETTGLVMAAGGDCLPDRNTAYPLMPNLHCAGDNNIVGGVPASWANMSNLNALDVTNACGICGALPAFPQAAVGQLQVHVASTQQHYHPLLGCPSTSFTGHWPQCASGALASSSCFAASFAAATDMS